MSERQAPELTAVAPASGWHRHVDVRGTMHFDVALAERDAQAMRREQLAMLEDAMWLIRAAFRGEVEGPLTLPETGLPVRVSRGGDG